VPRVRADFWRDDLGESCSTFAPDASSFASAAREVRRTRVALQLFLKGDDHRRTLFIGKSSRLRLEGIFPCLLNNSQTRVNSFKLLDL